MLPPCKDCINRGCGTFHDECLMYQEYVREKRKKNKSYSSSRPLKKYIKEDVFMDRANNVFRTHKR